MNYDGYSKEELIEILEKTTKYGLVWKDHPEELAEKCKTAFPYLKEVRSRNITTVDVLNKRDTLYWYEQGNNKIKYHTPHILIEGDNYHSLSVLNYTHRNSVDIIYIDPPYNTGNEDWRFNDKKVDKNTYEKLMGSYCDKTGFWDRNSEASKWTFTIKEPYHGR